MKHGFIKTAAVTPVLRAADTEFNTEEILKTAAEASEGGARIIVFPELAITGYTCQDLFGQELLLHKALEALQKLVSGCCFDALVFVGFPLQQKGKLYNTAAVIYRQKLLALIPKHFLPAYGEFYESRNFTEGRPEAEEIDLPGFGKIPFGENILLDIPAVPGLKVAAEICEDLWAPDAPDIRHALNGATMIVNLSASDETTGKEEYRRQLISSVSARLMTGYVYASSGDGESTQDLVFGGSSIIAENGVILKHHRMLDDRDFGVSSILYGDIDIHRLLHERRKTTTFRAASDGYIQIPVLMEQEETRLERTFSPHPFVPEDREDRNRRCEEILGIQSRGLARRCAHIHCEKVVIGISGGLDSTLSLLAVARTFDLLKLPRKNIIAVTMPCFGTTDRTYQNACTLTKALGAELREVNIQAAVLQHFRDIGHDPEIHDVTYENSQARERTQILMDIANQVNGLVIGTGDMSELALGWATYNGDHMSMYGTNAGIPKTLIRHLTAYCADTAENEELEKVLRDILDTPVSPELLPPDREGKISQKTEDLVGPYELHDFFLYYILRWGFEPSKIYRVACIAFAGIYENKVILYWLKTFCRRFFSQQFKRSCLPDGPKVGSVAVSPRGDLRMPSDASAALWMTEIQLLEKTVS